MDSGRPQHLNRTDSFEAQIFELCEKAETPQALLRTLLDKEPLFNAILKKGSPELLVHVLRQGVDPNDPLADFPLHKAVRVELGLDKTDGKKQRQIPMGGRQRHGHAFSNTRFGVIRVLLNYDADSALPDSEGATPVTIAMEALAQQLPENLSVREFLEVSQVHVDDNDEGFEMPEMAMAKKALELVLLFRSNDITPLPDAELEALVQPMLGPFEARHHNYLAAAEQGDVESVLREVREGTLVNYSDPDGHTALWFAVQKLQLSTVSCLLQEGANVNHKTVHGLQHTPIHAVCSTAPESFEDTVTSLKMLKLLVKATGFLDAQDSLGNTAMHLAGACGYVVACQVLLEAGASQTIANNAGSSAISSVPGGVDGALQALKEHKHQIEQHKKAEIERNERAARDRQIAWDRDLCMQQLMDMGYDKKLATQAVEATGSSQVDECVIWISEKEENDRQARDEKKRIARETREAALAEEAALQAETYEGAYGEDMDEDGDNEFAGWGSDSGSGSDGGWGSNDSGGDDNGRTEPVLQRYGSFVQMEVSELGAQRQALIMEAKELLCQSTSVVANLLPCYSWDVSRLVKEWFRDSEKVLADCGISTQEVDEIELPEGVSECGIMASADCVEYYDEAAYEEFEKDPSKELIHIPCGHTGCRACWRDCLSNSIADGNVEDLRCPNCMVNSASDKSIRPPAVAERMIKSCVEPAVFSKFERFIVKSFVDMQKNNLKWCPHPDCSYVVDGKDSQSILMERNQGLCVRVECGHKHPFCWWCGREPHAPVKCSNVKEWEKKAADEDGNETNKWIMLNTKECPNPKCDNRIEKNHGCDHMVCGKHAHGGKIGSIGCGWEFCWVCERPYSNHDYSECQKIGQQLKERTMSEKAGSHKELARYLAVFDSWQDQMKGIRWMEDKKQEYEKKIDYIQENSHDPNSFNICEGIRAAQQVVIDGRMSLRWCEVTSSNSTTHHPYDRLTLTTQEILEARRTHSSCTSWVV
eukprot:TRINITY_DN3003_c0_g4_i1.p1 TRINITY_DN3003_c0_g4~~TRINITY_DN3003_c0_g4_i1.p1  ORF type:complete len:989 (+),score=259.50 TRINITY_DN3003_c0_g4_i1:185-3151(+)